MGIKGISLSETKDFVSQYDKSEPKTIWKLGALDSEIFDLLGEDKNPLRLMSDAVRFGLKGIENFKDGNDNLVKFDTVTRAVGPYSYKVVADSIMKIIPPQVKSELGAEILKLSKLNEEETKN
jgi:hypothetical protein